MACHHPPQQAHPHHPCRNSTTHSTPLIRPPLCWLTPAPVNAAPLTHTHARAHIHTHIDPLPPGRPGPLWLLLRVQLHQQAGAARFRAGRVLDAYAHAQEALKLAGAVFHSLALREQGQQQQQGQQGEQGQQQAGKQQREQQQGGGPGRGEGAQGAPTSAASLLMWLSASAYMAALLQGARVFEACGCAEDAGCLLRCAGVLACCYQLHGMAPIGTRGTCHNACCALEPVKGTLGYTETCAPLNGHSPQSHADPMHIPCTWPQVASTPPRLVPLPRPTPCPTPFAGTLLNSNPQGGQSAPSPPCPTVTQAMAHKS